MKTTFKSGHLLKRMSQALIQVIVHSCAVFFDCTLQVLIIRSHLVIFFINCYCRFWNLIYQTSELWSRKLGKILSR